MTLRRANDAPDHIIVIDADTPHKRRTPAAGPFAPAPGPLPKELAALIEILARQTAREHNPGSSS